MSDLSHKTHARAILFLGLPLIGGHLAQMAIGVTDTVMLGWYGVEELAAETLAHSFFFVLFIMGSGFAWAVMPMVARMAAQNDEVSLRRVTRMGLWLSTGFAALVLPLFLFSETLLLAIGQSAQIADLASTYLRIAGLGIVPALLVMVLKSYLAALEHTRIVLWITLAAAVVNAGVNWLLIFGNLGFPELGIRGAAYASLSTQIVSLIGVIWYVQRVFAHHALFQRLWRADWPMFGQVFRLGWPISITNLAEVGLFAATSVMVGWLGTLPLAAHGIALTVSSVTFMIHLGLSNVATIRAGNAMGRGDRAGMARGALMVTLMSLIFAAITIVLLLGMPEPLISVFLSPQDPERAAIIALGSVLLAVAALFQLVDGAQVVALGLLRGAEDTRVPMVIATVSYWVIGLPSGYLFGFTLGWGATGIWLGLVVGLSLAGVALMARFWRTTLPRVPVS